MQAVQDILPKAIFSLQHITDSPQREACLLMAHALKTSYEDIYFHQGRPLSRDEEVAFYLLLDRRLRHEPLSKIRECREFWSLPFRVTSNTLDPRPDSETLIEAVLDAYPNRTKILRILDLGTGTGCLLLSLLHEFPNATGIGIDCSKAASLIAQENAHRLNYMDRAAFIVGNWADALAGTFDIIISNPPYIVLKEPLPPEVALYDPEMALFAGEDGLDSYRALANQIPNLVTPSSKLFLELGPEQLTSIISIFSNSYLLKAINDLQGHTRCAVFGMIRPLA